MKINIHHQHHVRFDEATEFVELVRAVHHNQQLLLQGNSDIMAQLDDLMGILQTIGTDVGQKAQQMLDLEQKLIDINNSTPPSVDLQPAIDLATSIRQSLESTASTAADATTDAGSGDTSGTSSGSAPSSDTGSVPSSDTGTTSSGGTDLGGDAQPPASDPSNPDSTPSE